MHRFESQYDWLWHRTELSPCGCPSLAPAAYGPKLSDREAPRAGCIVGQWWRQESDKPATPPSPKCFSYSREDTPVDRAHTAHHRFHLLRAALILFAVVFPLVASHIFSRRIATVLGWA